MNHIKVEADDDVVYIGSSKSSLKSGKASMKVEPTDASIHDSLIRPISAPGTISSENANVNVKSEREASKSNPNIPRSENLLDTKLDRQELASFPRNIQQSENLQSAQTFPAVNRGRKRQITHENADNANPAKRPDLAIL